MTVPTPPVQQERLSDAQIETMIRICRDYPGSHYAMLSHGQIELALVEIQSRRAADDGTGSRKSAPTRDEMVEALTKIATMTDFGEYDPAMVMRLYARRALSSHSTDQDDGEKR